MYVQHIPKSEQTRVPEHSIVTDLGRLIIVNTFVDLNRTVKILSGKS